MQYKAITKNQFNEWVEMELVLWPEHSRQEIEKDSVHDFASPKFKIFVAEENSELAGFLNLSLRTDYVQGATHYPVSYIEGLYVKPEFRRQGVASGLVKTAGEWALNQGCQEMASDAVIDNIDSQKFHEKVGFSEDERVVAYIKRII